MRLLSLKVKTWESILLVSMVLLSSLILVEAQRKNEIVPQVQADYTPAPYPLNRDVKTIVLSLAALEFGQDQVQAMDNLITHESNFNPQALNRSSGACGIFQFDPCPQANMPVSEQIQKGFSYIQRRYGTPKNAWKFWLSRQPINGKDVGNWY